MNGPAVTSLMRASGLTHGGFYKHFSSRDDLVVEAVQESLQELTDTLIHAAKQSGSNEGWRAMIKTYLSIERCDRPEIGCPIAALASDIARIPAAMKQQISAAILNFRANLIPFMPGKTEPEKSSNYLKIMTSMVGAIAIARTMLDRTVRQSILDSVRDTLLASF